MDSRLNILLPQLLAFLDLLLELELGLFVHFVALFMHFVSRRLRSHLGFLDEFRVRLMSGGFRFQPLVLDFGAQVLAQLVQFQPFLGHFLFESGPLALE